MKYLLLLAILLAAPIKAEIGADKFAHIGTSAAINGMVYLTMSAFTGREQEQKLPSLIGASIFTFSLGLAFKVMDAQNGYIDGGDMLANGIGIVTSATLIYLLDIKSIHPHPKGVAIDF